MLYSVFLLFIDIEVIKLFLSNIILKNIESISSIQLSLKLFSCIFKKQNKTYDQWKIM